MTQLTHFSVIVPVYNGAETLDACLTALLNQDYAAGKYELIVVNDGSTDDSARIASQYPVRLIDLDTNQGRIIARNAGAEAARYKTLVFNDARIIPDTGLLARVSQRNYQPLIPNVDDYDGSKWGFSRFFFLLRCKIYAPYYPLSECKEEFLITTDNFDEAPKGAGTLICDRDLWLACQPEARDKSTNDDTRILRQIVEHRPILRTSAIEVTYRQRTELKHVFFHTLERGPRFADYYLRRGGRYHLPYLLIWLSVVIAALGAAKNFLKTAIYLGRALLVGLGLVAVYLSRKPRDVIVVLTCFPVVVVAFGLGITKWQIAQLASILKGPDRLGQKR